MKVLGTVFSFPGGLAAGFAALALTGLSWSLVGVVMGGAPKRGVDTSYLQLVSAVISIAVSAVVMCFVPEKNVWTQWLPVSCYFFTGVINFLMLQLMSIAMQKGPNGVIWGMIQSGTIWPFISGVLFFGVAPAPVRLCGMVSLIAALFLFGAAKPAEKNTGKNWLLLTISAFCLCGFQQSITTIPSYFEQYREYPTVMRSMLAGLGTVLAVIIWNTAAICRGKIKLQFEQLKKPVLWGYVAVLMGFGLFAAYFLQYNGMDTLAAAGMGGVAYPLMVGSCIVGFSLYSMLIMREKNSWQQYLALVMCLAGIILLSIV